MILLSTSKDTAVGDIVAPGESVAGKHALVVGGTRGIGRGIALALAQGGCSVVVVGRHQTAAIVTDMEQAFVDSKQKNSSTTGSGTTPTFTAQAADLFTVAGAGKLVETLRQGTTSSHREAFDYVFFTVGCWPDYTEPFTTDGIEKSVALDLVARHAVLMGLIQSETLLRTDTASPTSRIVSVLASTQHFPGQSVEGVRKRLEEATTGVRPGRIPPVSLMPVGIAGDAWLRVMAQRYPHLHFVGTFPGVVFTDVMSPSFSSWLAPLVLANLWLIGSTEEEAGRMQVGIAASENVGRHSVSFYNHLYEARKPHSVSLNEDLGQFVLDWLEKICAAPTPAKR